MSKEFDLIHDEKAIVSVLHKARDQIEETMLKGMEKALLLIEHDAKKNCPVRKPKSRIVKGKEYKVGTKGGGLRASITHAMEVKDGDIIGRVGTNKNYAPYVHNGTGRYAVEGDGRKTPWRYKDPDTGEIVWTSGQKPVPFLQKAKDDNKNKIGEVFKEVFEKI
jgi:HK97 gp10 family phage protein